MVCRIGGDQVFGAGNGLEIATQPLRLGLEGGDPAAGDSEITEKAPIELEDVVRHVADELTPQADKAHVAIHCAADATPTVGDGLLLERLVHNLLENGIRYVGEQE